MQASIVDLRYHMNDVLKALDRNEEVYILCRGKVKGILRAPNEPSKKTVMEDPFFGMYVADNTVLEEMKRLRGGRYSDDF